MARWKCRPQKTAKNSPSGHHRTTLSGYIFATKARIGNRKKVLNSNTSSTCPDNMVNFGPPTAEIGSGVWGTPVNSNGFHILAALLHGNSGRQPKFVVLNGGRHLYSAGDHHVGHWLTFIVFSASNQFTSMLTYGTFCDQCRKTHRL